MVFWSRPVGARSMTPTAGAVSCCDANLSLQISPMPIQHLLPKMVHKNPLVTPALQGQQCQGTPTPQRPPRKRLGTNATSNFLVVT